MQYGSTIATSLDFATAVERTRRALAEQGLGVLTEIDVRATMQKKLGEDVEQQVILDACNLGLAFQALQADPGLALLLSCNVVVRREGDRTLVSALDPKLMVSLPGRAELQPVADPAARRLQAALNTVVAA